MKKVIVILLIIQNSCFAQFYDNTSIYGFKGSTIQTKVYDTLDNTILRYTEGNVKIELKKYIGIPLIWHTNSPFSDKNGNFSYLSIGSDVFNKDYKPLNSKDPLTKPLIDNNNDQFNLSLPMPNDDHKAMLIYGNENICSLLTGEIDSMGFPVDTGYWYSQNLYYAQINLKGKNNNAEYLSKGNIIINDSIGVGKFTATRHANGRDWWILASRPNWSNTYHTLLLDNKGLHYIKKQKIGKLVEDGVGAAHFSPNGKIYARLEAVNSEKPTTISIFDFDRCTGTLTNPRLIKIYPRQWGGMSISPNSRFLYFANYDKAYQYDLLAPDIEKSRKLIAEMDNFQGVWGDYANFYRMQLMPDRRIYCTSFGFGSEYFHIIQKPDLPYPYCRFEQHALKLPARNLGSIPNFPNYRLGPIDGSSCDTLGIDNFPQAWYRYEKDTTNKLKVEFTDLSFYEPKKWSWDFGDGSPMGKDTSPVHTFTKNGNYKVCLTVSNENGSHTHCKNINLGTTATNDAFSQENIQVSPSPFRERLFVALSEVVASPVFHLYDNTGRLVKTENLYYGITEIETNNLSAGLYFWNITSNGEVIGVGKVVRVE